MAPSHYLNQCWNIVNWTLRNKLRWNFNRNSKIFIKENAFENVVCEMASILSRPQCVNHFRHCNFSRWNGRGVKRTRALGQNETKMEWCHFAPFHFAPQCHFAPTYHVPFCLRDYVWRKRIISTIISPVAQWNDTKIRTNVHPCEKVIGIFFRHSFFTIYFLLFVLVFIHNRCEVVNINSIVFCWISITGYNSVTFWKQLLGKNPTSQ